MLEATPAWSSVKPLSSHRAEKQPDQRLVVSIAMGDERWTIRRPIVYRPRGWLEPVPSHEHADQQACRMTVAVCVRMDAKERSEQFGEQSSKRDQPTFRSFRVRVECLAHFVAPLLEDLHCDGNPLGWNTNTRV